MDFNHSCSLELNHGCGACQTKRDSKEHDSEILVVEISGVSRWSL